MCIYDLLTGTGHRRGMLLVGVALASLGLPTARAQSVPLAGTWQSDAGGGRNVLLVIENQGNKLKVSSTLQEKGGNELKAEFVCGTDAKECEFEERGHKSKVSMWYLGDALNICKTNGPAGDVVNEWKLQPSSDGKKLTMNVEHIDPTASTETLELTKK